MTNEKIKVKDKNYPDWVVCPKCGYNNHPNKVKFYGTCLRCNEVLDEKAKFKNDMYKKLRLWKGKRWG